VVAAAGDAGDAGGVLSSAAAVALAAAAVAARMRLSPSSHSRLRRGEAVRRVRSCYAATHPFIQPTPTGLGRRRGFNR
jgi:hypothetical protein